MIPSAFARIYGLTICGVPVALRLLLASALLGVFGASAQPASVTNGLSAYYAFDGDSLDSLGLHNGKPTNTHFGADRFGRPARALVLNGDGKVELGNDFDKKPAFISQSVWFTHPALPDGKVWSQTILTRRHIDSDDWIHMSADPQNGNGWFHFGFDRSGGKPFIQFIETVTSTHSFDFSKWNHLTVVKSNNVVYTYVNGQLEYIRQHTTDFDGTSSQYIVGYHGAWDRYFTGSLDDMRIYNRALSSTEVTALYNFESNPLPGVPSTATAIAQVVNGFVVGATITSGGSGYTNNPGVTISGGGGSGANATATIDGNGFVVSIAITATGKGYTSVPTITIAPPPMPPRRATGAASTVNGFVTGIVVTDPGFGYAEPPAVILIGGGGNGATATATVENGIVTGISIESPGSGYSGIPLVRIASPPFSPSLSVATSKVKVTQSVVLGRRYLLESTKDLVNWLPVGNSFLADDESIVVELDVDVVGRFFRIRQIP